jgi:hypothetical protein
MRKIKIVLLAIAVLASVSLFAQINAVKVGSKINVTVGGKFFTSYIFSPDEKYPFFYPVNGPSSGGSVTSMRNGEYPHHSSLFFGCDMLNDGNYWQEGLERGRIISVNAEILKEGGDSVVISDECIWSRPGALSPMKDKRLITITSPSPEIRIIDFAVEMEALQDVVIKKTNHSLFSARIAADLSVKNGGEMMNAEEASGEKDTFGKSSAWMSLSGRRGETVEGLVMMQHPSNRWYPAPWFTRDYGFISPTPMYWPENGVDIRLPKGDNIVLKYRVIVHSGVLSAEAVAHYFENYQKLK